MNPNLTHLESGFHAQGREMPPVEERHRSVISDLLALIYTFDCNACCDFCCHPPEEYGHGKMDPQFAISIIREGAQIGSVTGVAFSGGEPFLYYDEIVEICGEVQATALPMHLVTNCYWSRSRAHARDKLRVLQRLGVTRLGVSCDYTHQQFVPVENVKNAVWAALDVGLRVEVFGTFWSADDKVTDLIELPEGHPRIKVENNLVVPTGRARNASITPERYGKKPQLPGFLCGGKNRYDIAIYPNGDAYPCCSGGFNISAKLRMGNLYSVSLADVLEKTHADMFVRIAKEKSFQFLYDLVCQNAPQLYHLLPEYTDKVTVCQLCSEIHSDGDLMQRLAQCLEEYEITYVLEEMGLWENLLRE